MRTSTLGVPLLLAAAASACSGSSTYSSPSPRPSRGVASTAVTPATPSPAVATAAPAQSPVSSESNPPGDIPDNLAFVPFVNAAGHYSFTHPEGWAQTGTGSRVLFTDKLNGVEVMSGVGTTPPTTVTARRVDVPQLQRSQAAFELRRVTAVSATGGSGVVLVYRRNSAADPVTGRQYRDEVERYELVSAGHEVVMELYGPVGADNVDAYRTMVQSLRQR